jgi:hypothetical protein
MKSTKGESGILYYNLFNWEITEKHQENEVNDEELN